MVVKNGTKSKKTAKAKQPVKASKEQVRKGVSQELKSLVESLNKKFGDNAISIGVPNDTAYTIERIPTGSLSLDVALGGGLPLGRYIQIAGAFSSTKTTQTLHIIRQAQEMGLVCAFFDVEGTSDEDYFRKCGVDFDSLIYSRPDGSEEAFEMMLKLQKSGQVHLGVIDSLAALSPNKEQDTAMDETMRMGVTQQLLGEFFRKYQANNNRLNREGKRAFTLICINQLREKIGAYGDPDYAPGGKAKDFAMSVDLRLRRGDWITEGSGDSKEIVGQVVKFKVEKNKTYRRMMTGEFDFYFTGENNANVEELHNDNFKEMIILAVEFGVIERKGAWFMYEDQKFQGMNNLIEAFRNDDDLVEEVRDKVMSLAVRRND